MLLRMEKRGQVKEANAQKNAITPSQMDPNSLIKVLNGLQQAQQHGGTQLTSREIPMNSASLATAFRMVDFYTEAEVELRRHCRFVRVFLVLHFAISLEQMDGPVVHFLVLVFLESLQLHRPLALLHQREITILAGVLIRPDLQDAAKTLVERFDIEPFPDFSSK